MLKGSLIGDILIKNLREQAIEHIKEACELLTTAGDVEEVKLLDDIIDSIEYRKETDDEA